MKKTLFIIAIGLFAVWSSQAAEKSLNVAVMGTMSPEAVTFTGSYVYVKAGKEIKEDISGKGNLSQGCWGDYVKSCTVQKTSANGQIKLVIMEGDQKIFKSQWVTTNAPIVYEKK
jgi:hypothetical protein